MKLSRKQKELLLLWAHSHYGDLHVGSQDRVSVGVLIKHGLLTLMFSGWSSITAEGRKVAAELEKENGA